MSCGGAPGAAHLETGRVDIEGGCRSLHSRRWLHSSSGICIFSSSARLSYLPPVRFSLSLCVCIYARCLGLLRRTSVHHQRARRQWHNRARYYWLLKTGRNAGTDKAPRRIGTTYWINTYVCVCVCVRGRVVIYRGEREREKRSGASRASHDSHTHPPLLLLRSSRRRPSGRTVGRTARR